MKIKTLFFVLCISTSIYARKALPFPDIKALSPNVIVDAKYYGEKNFVGERIDGYEAPKCLLSKKAAQALSRAQKLAEKQELSLKAFDCYRPQIAVDHFVRWAKDLKDTKRKKVHYPYVSKENLFSEGYIASKSGHSRGSTIDLTLATKAGKELDMGGIFDYFDPLSHTLSKKITKSQLKNRLKLKSIMEEAGFRNYKKEWWHYTLRKEPYPQSYFSFPVK